jgi:hypothetical protein
MEQLVAGPMSILRKSGLTLAQKDFDSLLAATVQLHGKDSVEQADLLMSFGVELYLESFEKDDSSIAKASIDYLRRAIPAYRVAFGSRHPEVAVALNSYADALKVDGDATRADAVAALEEAYAIRLEALGADNQETRATANDLAALRDSDSFTSTSGSAAKAIDSAVETIQATTPPTDSDSEILTEADMDSGGLWKPTTTYDPLVDAFIADAKQLENADAVSRRVVAAKYRLSVAALNATMAFLRRMEKDGYDQRSQTGLRSDALRLVKLSKRSPIALMLAAGALGQFANGGCTADDVDALMEGSRDPDRDLWAIASICSSTTALAIAIDKAAAARPAFLYLGLNWTNGDPATELAAADMLLRPEFLAQVDEKQRDEVRAEVTRYKLSKLLGFGLLREALAFGDTLTPNVRALAFKRNRDGTRITIGEFAIKTSSYSDSTATDYAAALAVAGRNDEARSLLDLVAPASRLEQVRACLDAATKEDCGIGDFGQDRIPLGTLVVDQLLVNRDADPYVLLETAATGHSLSGGGLTEALCDLLSRRDEQEDCQELRDSVGASRGNQFERDDDRTLWASMERAGGQPFEDAKSRYAEQLAALGPVKPSADWTRATVDPAPLPFRESPIPTAILAKKPLPTPDPKAFAPLPEGYTPVRMERAGSRAIAISLSQRYDPDGEVTAGGYWLHLSDNSGKTWQSPLYTGLAEHFPYVVPASSRLSMFAGDQIRLEVEESLIDTASIGYPPVGTRIRRKRTGIYLDIPIAELRKDSDRDGITDIAAHHLLLDRQNKGPTPFIVGHDRNCSASTNAEMLAQLEILKKLFQVETRALIEPVGAKGFHFGDWRRTEATAKPPIFLQGNPGEFHCMAIDRLMIVYSDADREQLRKFSPDFQLIEVPAIHWNRDRTRGFVNWSMGWAGGTYRLVRTANGWNVTSIGEWIT